MKFEFISFATFTRLYLFSHGDFLFLYYCYGRTCASSKFITQYEKKNNSRVSKIFINKFVYKFVCVLIDIKVKVIDGDDQGCLSGYSTNS